MLLYGRKLTKKKDVYNTEPTIMVDPSKGLLKLSPKVISIMDMADGWLGLSADEVEKTGLGGKIEMEKELYFYKAAEKEGFKMSATGNVNSRFYARELSAKFNNGSIDKFYVELELESTSVEESDLSFFKVITSSKGLIDAPAKEEANESLQEIPELNDILKKSNGIGTIEDTTDTNTVTDIVTPSLDTNSN